MKNIPFAQKNKLLELIWYYLIDFAKSMINWMANTNIVWLKRLRQYFIKKYWNDNILD
jgi:hypothetical protein